MIDIEFAEPIAPGVYVAEKRHVFQKDEIEKRISELASNLPWIERMDVVDSEKIVKEETNDDETYEKQFLEQAQRAVKTGVKLLEDNGVLIKRPKDFYAEMYKSDEHMHKLAEKIIKDTKKDEMRQQVRMQRQEKQFGKMVQREVTQQKQKEKSEFLKEIKKYRKDPNSVDLKQALSNKPSGSSNKNQFSSVNKKRQFKNKKYSMGGKRSGLKRNTRESANDLSGFDPSKQKRNRSSISSGSQNKFKNNDKKRNFKKMNK